MENKKRQNLMLTGNGTVAAGVYDKVKIVGDETIHGDIDCIELKLTGTCEARGNVKAQIAKFIGTTDIKGNLKVQELMIVGNMNIDNDVMIKEFKVKGELKVKGNASIEKANIFGFVDIKGECNTEDFIVKGPFKIGGLLNAGNVVIEMHSECSVQEIGGEKIHIRRGTDTFLKKIVTLFYMPKDFYLGHLITDSIEGDEIYLEYVKANIVRGNHIEIGPGCEIHFVEYKNTLKFHESSNVTNQNKI